MTAGVAQAVLYSILGGVYTYLLLAALLAKNSEAKAERWFDFSLYTALISMPGVVATGLKCLEVSLNCDTGIDKAMNVRVVSSLMAICLPSSVLGYWRRKEARRQ